MDRRVHFGTMSERLSSQRLTHQHHGIFLVQDDTIHPDNVLVVHRLHDGGLLEELLCAVLHLFLAETLDCHLHLHTVGQVSPSVLGFSDLSYSVGPHGNMR